MIYANLLIRSIRYLVTCDDKDQLLEDVDLYCEDGFIRQIGPHLTSLPTEPSTPAICCATPVW
mgnify:CR=1 FL=1